MGSGGLDNSRLSVSDGYPVMTANAGVCSVPESGNFDLCPDVLSPVLFRPGIVVGLQPEHARKNRRDVNLCPYVKRFLLIFLYLFEHIHFFLLQLIYYFPELGFLANEIPIRILSNPDQIIPTAIN